MLNMLYCTRNDPELASEHPLKYLNKSEHPVLYSYEKTLGNLLWHPVSMCLLLFNCLPYLLILTLIMLTGQVMISKDERSNKLSE
jgi:hypothetical protein